jgi:outer membrane immunogenic protein
MLGNSITSRSAWLLLGVSALGCLAQSVPAFADTPAVPPASPAFSWTGVYVGANVGKTTGESTWNGPTGAGEFGGSDLDVIHDRSVTYGGQIGYNYQLPHGLLVGLEASLHGSHQSSGNNYLGGEGYSGLTAIGVRTHFGGDVSARFGATLDHLLAFGKVGYAFAHYDYTATNNNAVTYTGSQNRSGFLIGGGLEYALTRNWSIKGEYNHIGYTTKTVTLTGSDSSTFGVPIGETENTFKFGVNYRF